MHLAAIKETHYKENLESHFKNKAVKITILNCETEEERSERLKMESVFMIWKQILLIVTILTGQKLPKRLL